MSRTSSWATRGLIALVVLTAVSIYTVTDNLALANVCYLGVLVGASIGAWIGAGRAPRGRRLVPFLIAAGVSLTTLGDLLWSLLDWRGAGTDVSIADPAWFASYVVLCVGLWVVLTRSRQGSRVDLGFVIDAVTIVVVSVLVFWSITVDAIIADAGASPFVRAVWASYPIADAVLLALVVRVLLSRSARTAINASFAVGVLLWLAADTVYLQAPEGGAALALMDAAWMVAPVLVAHAAWSARDLEANATGSAVGNWTVQLLIAVGSLIVPAALELVADLRGQPDQPLQLLAGMTVLIALAFVRTARLILSEQDAHRELEVARDGALDASRAKSTFLANMSHEIRTPLTTVLATAELLEDTPLTGTQLRLLEKMHRSGTQLTSLIEQILDFSRIEARQLALRPSQFDLEAWVTDIADTYGPRARDKGIRFDWHLSARAPRRVVGDPTRLSQAVTHLLDNSLKFTSEGLVRLDVRPGDGEEIEFMVTDTGIGIAEENWPHLFDSFTQVDGSATRRYGGSGLGLAICKELAELMGGAVSMDSRLGRGSTFTVRVPLAQPVRTRRVEQPPGIDVVDRVVVA